MTRIHNFLIFIWEHLHWIY